MLVQEVAYKQGSIPAEHPQHYQSPETKMTLTLFREKPVENSIQHHTIVLDSSGSMQRHRHTVPEVVDAHIKALASDSRSHPNEEVRVSVFQFSSPGPGHVDFECLLYDMDVLRVPSIKGMYRISGGTALCDAGVRVLSDLQAIPVQYGKHYHLVWFVTDGQELHSTYQGRASLPLMIGELPEYYTMAAFTPDVSGKHFLTKYGFPQGNISIWDPTQENAIEEVGVAMAAATTSYTSTIRSGTSKRVTNLFEMKAPNVADLKKTLTPMTPGSYWFENVNLEDLAQIRNARIDEFYELKTAKQYYAGAAYYEMTKRERIQDYKKIAFAIWNPSTNTEDVYVGPQVRAKLGLPETGEVRVSPGRWQGKGYKVYILSTSNNRKLVPGTRVLCIR